MIQKPMNFFNICYCHWYSLSTVTVGWVSMIISSKSRNPSLSCVSLCNCRFESPVKFLCFPGVLGIWIFIGLKKNLFLQGKIWESCDMCNEFQIMRKCNQITKLNTSIYAWYSSKIGKKNKMIKILKKFRDYHCR